MKLKSTRLKFVFFGLLLLAFAFIQYSWVRSLQRDKVQDFKLKLITAIASVAGKKSFSTSIHELADTSIANIFRNTFSSTGLGNIKFEYAVALNNKRFASAGFSRLQNDKTSNLILHYELRHTGAQQHKNEMLTILVPKRTALKEMTWIIVASVLLTIMICVIFCSVSYFSKKEPRYDNRTNLVRNMMQQLESPLTTMSVATEALRNAKVMHDEKKINYYQQVITEESRHMNEQVEKFLREIK